MKKGVVMEKHKGFMIVMTNDGQFDRTKVDPNVQVGEEVTYIPLTIFHFSSIHFKRNLSGVLAALFFLLILTFFPLFSLDKVYSTVMIDINPSIEFSVDKNFNIIAVKGINEKGAEILGRIKAELKGGSLNHAATLVITEGNDLGYLSETNDIYISSSTSNYSLEFWGEDYENWMKQMQEKLPVNFISLTFDYEFFQQAKGHSLSPAKYILFKNAKANGIELNIAELKHTAIHEIEDNTGIELESIALSDMIVVSRLNNENHTINKSNEIELSNVEESDFETGEEIEIMESFPLENKQDKQQPAKSNPQRGKK